MEFVDVHSIRTALDIGAFKAQYLKLLIQKGLDVTGVDLTPDPDTDVQKYIVGNALEIELPKKDLVTCVSVVEHLGFLSLRGQEPPILRQCMIERCLSLANKYFYLTFPFGSSGDGVGYEHITQGDIGKWTAGFLSTWNFDVEFWYNKTPGVDETWEMVSETEAKNTPLIGEGREIKCVGVFKGTKFNGGN